MAKAKIKLVIEIAHLIASVMTGLLFVFLIPIFDEPFSGCNRGRFATLLVGCSAWPDVLTGLGCVVLVALIGPSRLKSHLFGFAAVTVVAALGGPSAIKTGSYFDLLAEHTHMVYYWLESGIPMLIGGVIGLASLVIFRRCIRRHNVSQQTQSGD